MKLLEQCTIIGVDNMRTKLTRTQHNKRRWYRRDPTWFELGGGEIGYFRRVDPQYYSRRACGRRVSIDFITQAVIRILLGFLKVSVELNSFRIAYGPSSLPVITVSWVASGHE